VKLCLRFGLCFFFRNNSSFTFLKLLYRFRKCVGSSGFITGVDQDNDFEVSYPSGNKWTLNPAVLTRAEDTLSYFFTSNGSSYHLLNNHVDSPGISNENKNWDNFTNNNLMDIHHLNFDKSMDAKTTFEESDFVDICPDVEKVKLLQRGHGEWAEEMKQVQKTFFIVSLNSSMFIFFLIHKDTRKKRQNSKNISG